MTDAAELPIWVALVVAALLLVGAGLTLTGAVGRLHLKSFYERVHAPTLGTTLGIGCVLVASMLFFSVAQTRLVLHECYADGDHDPGHAHAAYPGRALPRSNRREWGSTASLKLLPRAQHQQ